LNKGGYHLPAYLAKCAKKRFGTKSSQYDFGTGGLFEEIERGVGVNEKNIKYA